METVPPRVLIVENVDVNSEATATLLREHGYDVVQANSVWDARAKLKTHMIHLAIVDVRLVNERDKNDDSGLRLCREMDSSIPRIVVSGHTDWELVRNTLNPLDTHQPIAHAFFEKDEDTGILLAEIERVIRAEYDVIPRKRIAVVTSGGDAPGMNAAIFGALRTAISSGVEIFGVFDGYDGLVQDRIKKLRWKSFEDILLVGGTVLGTARLKEFRQAAFREKAAENLARRHISGLIVIGGDGSMQGAAALAADMKELKRDLQTVAIPGTIDNDLYGTEMSVGASSGATAVIREIQSMIAPAQALRRIFVCEVMGRYSGYLTLQAGLCIGADAILLPEEFVIVDPKWESSAEWIDHVRINETDQKFVQRVRQIGRELENSFATGKRHAFVLMSEGLRFLTTKDKVMRITLDYVESILKDEIDGWQGKSKPDVRTQVIGYPTRGPAPTRFDIQLGARMGAEAVHAILAGESNKMVGLQDGRIRMTNFDEVVAMSNRAPSVKWRDRPDWQDLAALHRLLVQPPPLTFKQRA